MKLRSLAAAAVLAISSPAGAAGIRLIDVPAGPFRGIVWSPCDAAAREIDIRDTRMLGTRDCAVSPGKRPLIIISHGRTGWSGIHHDTAAALADAGFIVASIDHPIDSSRSKTSRIGDIAYLTERPADIKLLIDFMLEASPYAANVDRGRVGFFGFSRGGYTGLVLVGGEPNREIAQHTCGPGSSGTLCQQIRDGKFPAGGFAHDARIKAAALADIAPGFFFGAEDLKNVRVPVALWASEHGGRGAAAETIVKIGDALPSRTKANVVRNAAHFVFTAPCSAERIRNDPEYCVNANGFDRIAFHREFNGSLIAFFRRNLDGQ